MRIKSITIEGLFGMFTHVIPLNQKEHITILYGMNGMGKTMIFRIMDCFFLRKMEELVKLPFHTFTIVFEQKTISVENTENGYAIYDNGEKVRHLSELFSKENFNTKTLENIYPYLIETQRLLNLGTENNHAIIEHAKELAQKIQNLKQESDKRSNSLRVNLVERVANGQINTGYSGEKLAEEIEKLNKRVEELKAVGLIEKDFKGYSWKTENVNEIQRAIFSVNIQDTVQILAAFDEIYPKLALFVEILNARRLVFKDILIDEKEGFIIINENNKKLLLTELSSGEQHEIILLYLMLFEIPENALIMIDEPEISLHIDWQADFVNDLTEIIELRGFNVILATHSPDIVNGRSELTVSLNKQEKQMYAN